MRVGGNETKRSDYVLVAIQEFPPPLNDLFSLKILKVFQYLSHELLAAVTQKERNLARESSDRLPLCVF